MCHLQKYWCHNSKFYGGVECGLRQFLITELNEIQSSFKLRPHFPCARGPGTLCLRRWVGASSSKNAMGQETFLSLLTIERDALLTKRDQRELSR